MTGDAMLKHLEYQRRKEIRDRVCPRDRRKPWMLDLRVHLLPSRPEGGWKAWMFSNRHHILQRQPGYREDWPLGGTG